MRRVSRQEGRGDDATRHDQTSKPANQNTMTRPNITPGPWNFQPCPENTWNVSGHIVAKNSRQETATAMVKGEANARAIAAVPALLEALEAAIQWSEAVPAPYRDWHFIKKARSALISAGYQF